MCGEASISRYSGFMGFPNPVTGGQFGPAKRLGSEDGEGVKRLRACVHGGRHFESRSNPAQLNNSNHWQGITESC